MIASAFRNAAAATAPVGWTDAIIVSFVTLTACVPMIAAAYLAKSALGINLMAGHSPLHDLLYGLVR